MGVTLGKLKSRAASRADMVGSGFISDDEWRDFANAEGADLHGILVHSFQDYFLERRNITIVSGTDEYALPADFLLERKAFILEGSRRAPLRRFNLEELDSDHEDARRLASALPQHRYRIVGSKLRLHPSPTTSATVELWYAPQFRELHEDHDELDYAIPVAWSDYMVAGMAIRALAKEQGDTSQLMAEKAVLEQKIQEYAANRTSGSPATVVNMDHTYMGDPY